MGNKPLNLIDPTGMYSCDTSLETSCAAQYETHSNNKHAAMEAGYGGAYDDYIGQIFPMNQNQTSGGYINPGGASGPEDGQELSNKNDTNELLYHSSYTYVYDGQQKIESLEIVIQGGQTVRIDIRNMNLLGVQLDVQDKMNYEIETNWLGVERKTYDTRTSVILPGQKVSHHFDKFSYAPMTWNFELSTKVSGAAFVQVTIYSNWVPGMAFDPHHPYRNK